MKFVYFNDTRFGAVDGAGTGVVDLTETAARLPHRDRRDLVAAVIAAYDEIAPALIAATAAGPALPLADVALLPPLPAPPPTPTQLGPRASLATRSPRQRRARLLQAAPAAAD